jgi:hypothetical protein
MDHDSNSSGHAICHACPHCPWLNKPRRFRGTISLDTFIDPAISSAQPVRGAKHNGNRKFETQIAKFETISNGQ